MSTIVVPALNNHPRINIVYDFPYYNFLVFVFIPGGGGGECDLRS